MVRELSDEMGVSSEFVHFIMNEDLHSWKISDANDWAKATPFGDRAGHAVNCKQRNKLLKHSDHWRYVLNLLVLLRNTVAVIFNEIIQHPRDQKRARQIRSNVKVLLIVFLDFSDVAHHEYAPHDPTITNEYYLEVLRHLRVAVWRKRQDLWPARNWQLHHRNAPAHSLHEEQNFLAKHNIPVLRQAPHSPNLAQCDFWLFPSWK